MGDGGKEVAEAGVRNKTGCGTHRLVCAALELRQGFKV